jgi:hypothetical protein
MCPVTPFCIHEPSVTSIRDRPDFHSRQELRTVQIEIYSWAYSDFTLKLITNISQTWTPVGGRHLFPPEFRKTNEVKKKIYEITTTNKSI